MRIRTAILSCLPALAPALSMLAGCSSSTLTTGLADGGSGGPDASVVDGAGSEAGVLGEVTCTAPGNAGSTGHGCNFLLSPNVGYPSGASNNDLPPVSPPTSAAPHGDADPCTRQDPSSANLYMTYTYTTGGFLSTKMAYSTNGGEGWTASASTPVWSGSGGGTTLDPYTGAGAVGGGAAGVINSETSNLAFRSVPGGVVVYGVHEIYWETNGLETDLHTKRLDVAETYLPANASPSTLHDALAAATDGAPNVAALQGYPNVTACPGPECSVPGAAPFNLQKADGANGALADCVRFHEPAVHWQPSPYNTLYLVQHCQSNARNNRIVVFGTTSPANDAAVDGGTGSPQSWTWAYEGFFLTTAEAATAAAAYGISEPTAPYFTQGEVATARDGSLLYLTSLVHLEGNVEARDAVFVFKLASLSPAALSAPVTSTPGAAPYVAVVRLKLAINGGDDGLGPGSSTYDPALTAAGVVYAGRTYPGLPAAMGFESDLFSFPTVTP